MDNNKKIITAQVDLSVYTKLKELSEANYTTISSIVRKIVSEYCLSNPSNEENNLDERRIAN